jgi:hypothetical protein
MGKGDAGKTVKSAKAGAAAKPAGKPAAAAAKGPKGPEKKPAAKPAAPKAPVPAKAPAKVAEKAPVKADKAPVKADKAPKAEKPAKADKAPKAEKPAKAAESKPASKAGAPAAAAAPTTSAEVAGVVRKKKNVKRGAPPMLPRRNMKREIPPPGSPPPPPRAPMMPGSLHAPARAPEGAELIKKKLSIINNLLSQLKGMKRSLGRQFYEVGLILTKLSDPDLFKTRNYASFDAFVEREIEREINIGRSEVAALVKIVKLFQRDAAEEIGLEKLRAALKVLYPDPTAAAGS